MKHVRAFLLGVRAFPFGVWKLLRGVWKFVVGDDWRTALGVALALALTALLSGASVPAWWVMPVAVLLLLALSIRRAALGTEQKR